MNSRKVTASHNPKYNTRISNVTTDAVIIPKGTFKRVRNESIHITAGQQITMSQELDQKKRSALKTIKDRRTNLLEAERIKQLRQQELEKENEMEERDYTLKVAEAKGNEELDEVKAMNAEMIAARVRTIRDHQLMFNQQKKQREKEEEARMAQMMENERQRALGIYAERQRMLDEQRRQGGAVLLAQIEEKRQNDLLEKKRREREKEEMIKANEIAKEEDLRLQEERKKRSSEFLSECMAANKISLLRKQREKEREIEEAQAIVEYQREKAAREDAYEETVRQAKQQKELEIAELRKKQQRMIDTQAEEDELRARRIMEEKERKAREKELADLKKKQEEREMMQKDREQAIALKQKRLIEIAKIERAEFDRIMAAQRQAREKDRQERERKQRLQEKYRIDLETEMKAKREEKRMIPLVNLDEQKHMQEQQQDYIDRLERIRQMKLNQLREEGVPEKYLADLQNMQFVVK